MTELPNDHELVKQFLAGNQAAFNKIAIRYQQKIYWHARRMAGNHQDADEIVQEVLLVIYNKLHTFKFNSSLYTWIYRITSTRSINFLRKKKIKQVLSFEDVTTQPLDMNNDIVKTLEDKEKIDKINNALQYLPLKQREVFVMRTFEELSYDEIAEITGKSIGGLKANYFHAVNKLTEIIKNEN